MVTEKNNRGGATHRQDLALAKEVALKLLAYCRQNEWAGYDPYDALNSKLYENLPILHFRFARLVLTQGLKRCPVNLRPLLLVPKAQNPKGLALFLSALLKLSKAGLMEDTGLIRSLAERLQALRSPGVRYWCWGYSFPWQTRTLLVKRGAPNLVSTTFAANAFLDLFKACADEHYLELARSAAEYLLDELYWSEGDGAAGFRYPAPDFMVAIHNANLLGAALLCRVASESGESRFLVPALRAARYSARCQREDGSWAYGESPTQGWVDNFHTGYNICALKKISEYGQTDEFEGHLKRGFEFYREHFFGEDGRPHYYHNRSEPLDVHSAAQSILTLLQWAEADQANLALACSVARWATANLWNPQGYFSYQKRRWGTIRIPYMRWGQAWMLYALAALLEQGCGPSQMRKDPRPAPRSQEARV